MRFLILVCALLAAEAAKLEGYVSQQPGSPSDLIPHIPSDDSSVAIGNIPTDSLPGQPEQSIADEIHSFARSDSLISGQVASGQGQFLSDQPLSNLGSTFSAQTVSKSGPIFSDQSISGLGQVFSDQPVSQSGSIFLDQPVSGSALVLSEQSATGVGPIFYDQTNIGSGQEIHGHDLSSSVSQPFDPSSAQLLSATLPGLSVSGNTFVNDQSSLTISNSQFSQASSQTYGPPAVSQTFDSSAQILPAASSGLSGSGQSFVNDQSSLTFPNTQFSNAASQIFTSPGEFQPVSTQGSFGQGSGLYSGSGDLVDNCLEGQILHVDGRCVTPEVSRHVFVYAAPKQESKVVAPPTYIPLPKVEHNIVFIRAPDSPGAQDPIIIPPPQKKNIIYVLNKESEIQGPKVIEVPAPKSKNPEVYFVNYADGENPLLPGGIDFETALNSAVHSESQVIGGGNDIALSGGGDAIHSNFGATVGSGDEVIGASGPDFSGAFGGGVTGASGPDFSGAFGDSVTGTTGPDFSGAFGGGVTGASGLDFSGATGTTSSGFSPLSEPDFGGETFPSLKEGPSKPVLNPEESLLSNDQISGSFGNEIAGPSFESSPAPPPALSAQVPQQLYAAP